MTNREWLIWKLIDMSDEEFADRVCGQRNVWSCDDCVANKITYACPHDCYKRFHEWLKQEHKDNSKLPKQDKKAVQDLMAFKARYKGLVKDTHYAGDIQPIKLMEAQMTPEAFCGYLRGNIIKYCSRYGKKKGADTEDEARKIQQYAKWLHEASKGDKITV